MNPSRRLFFLGVRGGRDSAKRFVFLLSFKGTRGVESWSCQCVVRRAVVMMQSTKKADLFLHFCHTQFLRIPVFVFVCFVHFPVCGGTVRMAGAGRAFQHLIRFHQRRYSGC